jgi:monoamine oxidase
MTSKIVVLGAGYSGLAAAKLAAKWTSAHVTLVNANDRFVERVRLHQLAAGRFKYFNQCISLGRKDGLIQFVHQDDSPRPAILTGRAAAIYKEAVVRGTILFERNPVIPASL